MYILSIDTAAKTASVCVSEFSEAGTLRPLSKASVYATLTHSESLLPMIDFCLARSGKKFEQIGMIAVNAGPGSFTGVRIGVSTAKGLAFGKTDMLCVTASALESLACNVANVSPSYVILALMDARRSQFYNAFFRPGSDGMPERVTPDALLTFDEIVAEIDELFAGKEIMLVGDGAELFYGLYEKSGKGTAKAALCGFDDMYQNAFSVARCALKSYLDDPVKAPENYTSEKLAPVYLRASQAERERIQKLSERGI